MLSIGRVKPRPDGDQGVAVEIRPAILMPRQFGAPVRGLVHEHCPETGDGHFAINVRADLPEERQTRVRAEHGMEFQILNFPIVERGALEPARLPPKVAVRPRRRVELHEQL